jgi:hypothetical protein
MKINLNLDGKPVQKEPKCAICGKPKSSHNYYDRGCPIGVKHRTLGYTQFSSKTKFTPKEPRGNSKKG